MGWGYYYGAIMDAWGVRQSVEKRNKARSSPSYLNQGRARRTPDWIIHIKLYTGRGEGGGGEGLGEALFHPRKLRFEKKVLIRWLSVPREVIQELLPESTRV